jgi:uncharacterized membrane protein YfcA
MALTAIGAATIFGSAILGGAINVLVGGGSFITFPTLLAFGIPPIAANATNTVGLWPASLAGAWALRQEIYDQQRQRLAVLGAISIVGGLVGAWLLLRIPTLTFVHLLPYLMGVATLLFAFGKQLTPRLRKVDADPLRVTALHAVLQFPIAVYGGFYGGGVGIMMMAGMAVAGMEDMVAMNALKNLLTALVNGTAVLLFAYAGAVEWPAALVMVTGAVLGGYAAGRVAKRIDPAIVRACVIALGTLLTVYFFFKN